MPRTIRLRALTRNVDTAQKTADVSGKNNDHAGQELQRQAVTGKRGTRGSSLPKMDPPNQTNKKTGRASQDEVEQQQSLQFVSLELPLPCCDAGCERRQHKSCCGDQVETCRCR